MGCNAKKTNNKQTQFHFLKGRAYTDIAKGNMWAEETGHVAWQNIYGPAS
jgi:hypothetical protein